MVIRRKNDRTKTVPMEKLVRKKITAVIAIVIGTVIQEEVAVVMIAVALEIETEIETIEAIGVNEANEARNRANVSTLAKRLAL